MTSLDKAWLKNGIEARSLVEEERKMPHITIGYWKDLYIDSLQGDMIKEYQRMFYIKQY